MIKQRKPRPIPVQASVALDKGIDTETKKPGDRRNLVLRYVHIAGPSTTSSTPLALKISTHQE